ncbi:hypothetical protein LCM23_13010 [Cytobacillus kochii]|uniref:hypothetical protein n=1 Tax=Cytobacillus kochii TaxID=859143 RepID=UPI001CD2E6DD|nr:hypothetical protein [Cytobacillus kochii]MCA1027014.1 hypothetical protein [Cytobacillus kochii]
MEKRAKKILANLKMFIDGDECLEVNYSDVLEVEELIEKQQKEIELLKRSYVNLGIKRDNQLNEAQKEINRLERQLEKSHYSRYH